jgi:stage II sporulation protein R
LKRKGIYAIAIGLFIAIVCNFLTGFASDCNEIRDKVLRLHILANSDTQADQQLKLSVRDRILEETGNLFYDVNSKEEAKQITQEHLEQIKAIAQDEIKREGYDYSVEAEVCRMFFETREYDEFTLPAGQYDAVRITIGEAKGHNWWCVLYPMLCIPAAQPEEDLEQVLGEDQAQIVEHADEYEVEFAIVEFFERIKNAFS